MKRYLLDTFIPQSEVELKNGREVLASERGKGKPLIAGKLHIQNDEFGQLMWVGNLRNKDFFEPEEIAFAQLNYDEMDPYTLEKALELAYDRAIYFVHSGRSKNSEFIKFLKSFLMAFNLYLEIGRLSIDYARRLYEKIKSNPLSNIES